MSEITEETYKQVRSFLMLKGQLCKDFVPLMSDDALILAKDVLIAEANRRFSLKHDCQEKTDATPE